jgi:membrane-associated phospholipid phosphatase
MLVRRWPVGLTLWLAFLIIAQIVAFVMVSNFFVLTRHGQLLDTAALAGNTVGQVRIAELVNTVLNTISVVSLAIAMAIVAFIALIRRRVAVGVGAILLIVGANVTTQLLKALITRPELGVDLERAAAGNSLPSGHTTTAASVAVALLLVLPARLRGIGAVLGAIFTAVAGVATLSAGWHRPSDGVAALLVVGGWAGVAGLFIVLAQRRHGGVEYGQPSRAATIALTLAGFALLAGSLLATIVTDRALDTSTDEWGRYRLLTAYAGGAAAIAGAAALLLASVLATVHRVVPRTVPGYADSLDPQDHHDLAIVR